MRKGKRKDQSVSVLTSLTSENYRIILDAEADLKQYTWGADSAR